MPDLWQSLAGDCPNARSTASINAAPSTIRNCRGCSCRARTLEAPYRMRRAGCRFRRDREAALKKRPHLIEGGAEGDAMPARKPVNPSLTSIVGKCEGATGSLAIVAPGHGSSHPRSIHHGSRLPAMPRGEPQVGKPRATASRPTLDAPARDGDDTRLRTTRLQTSAAQSRRTKY
jgi:hypothetical protein